MRQGADGDGRRVAGTELVQRGHAQRVVGVGL